MSAKAKAAAEIAEETVEVIEETLDTLERIPRVALNGTTRAQQILILSTVAATSAVIAGVVVGKIVQKRMNLKIDSIVADEVDQTRKFYSVMTEKPPIETLAKREATEEEDVVAAAEMVRQYQGKVPYNNPGAIEETPEVEVHNVFVEGKVMNADDFDYDAELATRSEDAPYVISFEEFQADEKDYVRNTLTWYEGDDTLTDDKEQPIPDVDAVVGEHNMVRFGHGSRDPNIVYVRNDRMEVDFEVVHNKSAYSAAVLGFQHSDRPGSRKTPRFRGDDG